MTAIPGTDFHRNRSEAGSNRTAPDRHRHRRWIALCVMLLVPAAIGIAIWRAQRASFTLPERVSLVEYETAKSEFESNYGRRADNVDVLSWLAEKSVKNRELEKAAACFERIPTSHPRYGRSARHQQGNVLMLLDRAAEAEQQLREFIELERVDPRTSPGDLIDAIERLRYVLEVQLRYEERRELIAPIVRSGRGDVFDVMYYCFPSLLRWNGPAAVERLEEFWRADPDNLKLRIALGRYRTGQGRLDEAAEILAKCRRDALQDGFALAAELALFRERGEWDRIHREVEKLPPPSASDPWLLLLVRGRAYNRQQNYEMAVRCFELVLQNDPANAECCIGLAAAYGGLNRPDDRKRVLTRSRVLARIQNRLGWGQTSPEDVQPFIEIAELCEQIELYEQGLLIAKLARRSALDDIRLQQLIPRFEAALRKTRRQ